MRLLSTKSPQQGHATKEAAGVGFFSSSGGERVFLVSTVALKKLLMGRVFFAASVSLVFFFGFGFGGGGCCWCCGAAFFFGFGSCIFFAFFVVEGFGGWSSVTSTTSSSSSVPSTRDFVVSGASLFFAAAGLKKVSMVRGVVRTALKAEGSMGSAGSTLTLASAETTRFSRSASRWTRSAGRTSLGKRTPTRRSPSSRVIR
mmetsp:Transcript_11841/g.39003  ORF Transcript_11841/g.39003 Transcript_11841/m.39003 type:complete len:201 (+) Transcript_11841:140-742(+)